MKNILARLRHLPLLGILVFLFIFITGTVLAVGKPSNVGGQSPPAQAEEAKEKAKNKLTEAKLRACQNKETSIRKRIDRLTQLTTKIETNFDKHAQMVEEYYTSTVLPSGKTVANYDELIADIQTRKEAVQTALLETQGSVGGFDCEGDDPKGQLKQFRTDIQAVKKALKDYRFSIKNLIVGVRSVTGSINKDNNASPEATVSQEEDE